MMMMRTLTAAALMLLLSGCAGTTDTAACTSEAVNLPADATVVSVTGGVATSSGVERGPLWMETTVAYRTAAGEHTISCPAVPELNAERTGGAVTATLLGAQPVEIAVAGGDLVSRADTGHRTTLRIENTTERPVRITVVTTDGIELTTTA